MIPWLVAIGALTALIALWLRTTQHELLPLRDGVQGAEKQTRLYWDLLCKAEEDREKQAYMEERYLACSSMYTSQALRYNETLQGPYYAPVAWILGFYAVPEVIEFDL